MPTTSRPARGTAACSGSSATPAAGRSTPSMVAAGLWLLLVAATPGQPDAGVARGAFGGTFVWDIPEVVEDIPIGGTMVVDGLPMVLRRVRTRWKLEPMAKKLAADFIKAGLW